VEIRSRPRAERVLAVDAAVLAIKPRSRPREFPNLAGAVAAALFDDAEAARLIATGALDRATVHFAGPGRFYSYPSEFGIQAAAAGLADAVVDLLVATTPTALPFDALLRRYYGIEFRHPLRPFLDLAALAADAGVDCVRLPYAGAHAAPLLRAILERGLPDFRARDAKAKPLAAPFMARPAPAHYDVTARGPFALVRSGSSRTTPSRTLDPMDVALEALGLSAVDLAAPPPPPARASVRTYSPAALAGFYHALRASGCGRLLAARLAPNFLFAHAIRLGPLLALYAAGLEYGGGPNARSLLVMDYFRHPGLFFGAGARAAAGRLDGVNRHLQLPGKLLAPPFFDRVFDASGAIDGREGAVPVRPLTADSPLKPAETGMTVISQPLSREMDRLVDDVLAAGMEGFAVQLHPADGPAAEARWRRRLAAVDAAFWRGASGGAPTRVALGATSTLLPHAAAGGIAVAHVASEAVTALVWPDQTRRPGPTVDLAEGAGVIGPAFEVEAEAFRRRYEDRRAALPSLAEAAARG